MIFSLAYPSPLRITLVPPGLDPGTAVFNVENQQGDAGQLRDLCSILCNNLMVTRGKDGEGIVRESAMDMDTLLDLTWRTSKDLLDSSGNSAEWQPGWEGSLGDSGYLCLCG